MSGFPLLLIPLAICNIIVFLMPGVSFGAPLFTVALFSGAPWSVTLSDGIVAFGLLLLLLEVLKNARSRGKYLTDHLLALLIFGGAAAEFVMLPQFANATFFLLTLIALVDFLSGIGLRARRPRRAVEVPAEPVHEPVAEPAPRADIPVTSPRAPESMFPSLDRASAAFPAPRIEPIIDQHPSDGETPPERPAATPP